MKNLRILAFLIAVVSIDAAFSAEVLTSKDGLVSCTVLEDARIHCWNTNSKREIAHAQKKIAYVAKEAAYKQETRLPSKGLITLADL
jgi:hypothetical protein